MSETILEIWLKTLNDSVIISNLVGSDTDPSDWPSTWMANGMVSVPNGTMV